MNKKDSKMIVVSNAEPYKHVTGKDNQPTCKEVEGGLTTAMNPQMRDTGGVWIAYGRGERDFEVLNEKNEVKVPDFPNVPEKKKYRLKRLNLPEKEYENFYRGYANKVLWPICHSFPTKAELENEDKFWKEGYLPCNKKYASAVLDAYEEGDTIWVHDYHLALVPLLIRKEVSDAKIGVFWHIPWAPWESFGKVPHRDRLIEGLAAADLVGLHIEEYVENLLKCADQSGAEVDRKNKNLEFRGEKAKVGAYPLGVDFNFFNCAETGSKEEEIREKYGAENVILGVDRQDYTKGIPERIRAFERFIEENPDYSREVSLIQRTPLSRTGIEEYQLEKETINRKVSEFNGKYGGHGWKPINQFWGGIPQKDLIGEYRAADVGLVTPRQDGMNLVAKEFVAANEEPKVLILSEFAGANRQLEGALRVNPYDTKKVSQKIKEAIEMPESEKRRRWQKLRSEVKEKDLPQWALNFLGDLNKAHKNFNPTQKLLGLNEM